MGFDGSLRRTADGGATWSLLFDRGITSISRAPKGALIALADFGVMRRSVDGGATWTPPVATVPGQPVFSIVENDAGTWIATASAVYVLDRGSFRIATAGMGGLGGSAFSDPSTGFMYAAWPVGLYRFDRSRAPELIFDGLVRRVTFDPSSPGAMFAETWNGFFRSTDAGSTWSKLPDAPGLPLASPDGHTWYADGGGLWRSDDAGSSWTSLWKWDVGLPRVTAMSFDNDAILFASGADTGKVLGGVFRSDDRGKTYRHVKSGMTFQLVTVGSSLVVPEEVSRTDDFGRTFTPLFSGHEFVKWLAASAKDPRVLIALEQPAAGALPPAIYRTNDGGATWTRCLSGLERPNISQIELDPADGTTLYAATDQGLFRSSNACPTGH